ncbi:hypothetical protein [Actinomyces vulturis]|uniref:hypothetical protein n=1 Tax=Actinomyces vulturis TaxID=1857645 RepID=UPI000832C334|nr:hypothetical protein [Actinomyces vulturis]
MCEDSEKKLSDEIAAKNYYERLLKYTDPEPNKNDHNLFDSKKIKYTEKIFKYNLKYFNPTKITKFIFTIATMCYILALIFWLGIKINDGEMKIVYPFFELLTLLTPTTQFNYLLALSSLATSIVLVTSLLQIENSKNNSRINVNFSSENRERTQRFRAILNSQLTSLNILFVLYSLIVVSGSLKFFGMELHAEKLDDLKPLRLVPVTLLIWSTYVLLKLTILPPIKQYYNSLISPHTAAEHKYRSLVLENPDLEELWTSTHHDNPTPFTYYKICTEYLYPNNSKTPYTIIQSQKNNLEKFISKLNEVYIRQKNIVNALAFTFFAFDVFATLFTLSLIYELGTELNFNWFTPTFETVLIASITYYVLFIISLPFGLFPEGDPKLINFFSWQNPISKFSPSRFLPYKFFKISAFIVFTIRTSLFFALVLASVTTHSLIANIILIIVGVSSLVFFTYSGVFLDLFLAYSNMDVAYIWLSESLKKKADKFVFPFNDKHFFYHSFDGKKLPFSSFTYNLAKGCLFRFSRRLEFEFINSELFDELLDQAYEKDGVSILNFPNHKRNSQAGLEHPLFDIFNFHLATKISLSLLSVNESSALEEDVVI